jgi:hypothetical protein
METKRNFLDLDELHEEVFNRKLSKSYLYVMVKQGKINVKRFGKKILVPVSEANRLLAEGVE